MNPKHCVSLELSKKLKEVGWKKETEFYFVDYENPFCLKIGENVYRPHRIKHSEVRITTEYAISLPLATEILEELPEEIKLFKAKDNNDEMQYWCEKGELDNENWKRFYDKSAPNALAKMWLYLKQKGLI